MNKRTLLLALLCCIPLVLNADDSTIPYISRLSDIRIELVKNSLLASEKKARIIRPLTGMVLGTAAVGGLGYLGYSAAAGIYKRLFQKDEPPVSEPHEKIGEDRLEELLNRATELRDEIKKEQSAPWYRKVTNNVTSWLPTFIALWVAQRFTTKILETAATNGFSIDSVLDYFVGDRTIEWFKDQRTTYDLSLNELRRHIQDYAGPELKEFQKLMLAQQIMQLKALDEEEKLTPRQRDQMLGMQQEIERLDQQSGELSSQQELFARQRVATSCAIFLQQVEKILGFMAFIEVSTSYQLARITAGQIATSIKTIATQLRTIIEQEIKVAKDGNLERVLTSFNQIIDIIGESGANDEGTLNNEIRSFGRVHDLIDEAATQAPAQASKQKAKA